VRVKRHDDLYARLSVSSVNCTYLDQSVNSKVLRRKLLGEAFPGVCLAGGGFTANARRSQRLSADACMVDEVVGNVHPARSALGENIVVQLLLSFNAPTMSNPFQFDLVIKNGTVVTASVSCQGPKRTVS